MKDILLLFFLLFFLLGGVFGESVSLKDGDSVTLHTDLTEIQKEDVIQWRFGDILITEFDKEVNKCTTYEDALDGRFKNRLNLHLQSGDLTIKNATTILSGLYKVANILNTVDKIFNVIVEPYEVDKRQSVSVLVGDSVTLNTDVPNTQTYNVIQWRFKHQNSLVAEINRKAEIFNKYDGPDGIFRHRLQLDYWTGSLTITNIGTNHSGLYEVGISKSSIYTIHKTFSVTVSGEIRKLSVMKGDSVTLHTDAEVEIYDFMLWIFADSFIAEIYKAAQRFSIYDGPDGRFRDRLELDHKTGSLIIKNIRTEHVGLYDLKIISSTHTVHKRISVTVNEMRSLSVMEGDSVILHTETDIQRDDLIMWKSGDTQIAEMYITDQQFSTSDGPDGRFRNRLELDHKTGSLNIKNIRTEHAGLYDLKIISSRHTVHKRISVTVNEMKSLSKNEENSVTLHTDTEIQNDDLLQWMFGKTVIAEIDKDAQRFYIYPVERFRDRLELDHQTGSLTITNTRTTDSGLYELKISSSRRTINMRFAVIVTIPGLSPGAVAGIVVFVLLLVVAGVVGMIYYRRRISALERKKMEAISVTEGCNVPLLSGVTEIQRGNMQWTFRDEKSPIAQIKGGTGEICVYDGSDGRFKGRLKLDSTTGSLTIKNTRTTDSGLYQLLITRSGTVSSKQFSVTVSVEAISVTEGDCVIVNTNAKIERDDQMLLLFGEQEFCIGQIKGGTEEFSTYDDVPDDRFKGRLELNRKTRSVNIKDTSTKDSGLYKLLIIGSGAVTSKTFSVTVSGNTASIRNQAEDLPLMSVDVSNSRL